MYLMRQDKRIATGVDGEKADLFAALMLQELGGRVNYMKLMKLLYFADRYHLRRYMRPIAKDDYFAMKKGVVGSYWLDLLRGLAESNFFTTDKPTVSVVLKAEVAKKDTGRLSESEVEAMKFALQHFGAFNENKLVDIIHEYPEWEKFKDRFSKNEGREDIDIRDIVQDPSDNDIFRKYGFKDPFKPLSAKEKEMVVEAVADYVSESL